MSVDRTEVSKDPKDVSKEDKKEIRNFSFIVQKYIEEPLLFQKRKFDIRIWALISHDQKCTCSRSLTLGLLLKNMTYQIRS